MAKSLPGLVIKIGANTKDAIDGLNRVNRAVGKSASGADRLRASWAKAGPALLGAAAGVALLAAKLGTDGVQAAMDEQRELVKLNTTLGNLGFGDATDSVSKFIDNLQYAANVSDTDLRDAFETLLRGTHDVAKAQEALSLALDISAGTGRDLAQVSKALGRGYAGNTQGLSRLGAGLSKATLKAGDMNVIAGQLKDTFGGQSSAQADTLYGSVKGVQIAYNELIEAFGGGLMGTGAQDAKQLQDIEAQLRALQPSAQRAGEDVRNLGAGALTFWDRLTAVSDVIDKGDWGHFWEMMQAGASGSDDYFAALVNTTKAAGTQFQYTQYAAYKATNTVLDYKTAAEDTALANDRQTDSLKRLQAQLDKLAGKRSIMRERLDLTNLLNSGPSKSGSRKGAGGKMMQFATGADRQEFALNVADQSASLASDLLNAGKRGQSRDALSAARDAIRGMNLPRSFKSNLLSTLRTPSGLQYHPGPMAGTPQTGAQVAGINYNFYGDIKVDSDAAIQKAAKEARRLAQLSGNRYAGMAATGRGYRK